MKQRKPTQKAISAKLPADLVRELSLIAKREHRSLTKQVEIFLRREINLIKASL